MFGDGLAERLLRFCERAGVPHDIAERAVERFAEGRHRFGQWNHLTLTADELRTNAIEEVLDLLNYLALIPWSQAHHAPFDCLTDEDADAAVDADLLESVLDLYRQVERTNTRSARR